jgi:seryl-tRNA(Sec) selenium transferase
VVITEVDPDELTHRLRHHPVPVVCRIERDRVVADVRTVGRDDEDDLVSALVAALR